MVHEVMDSGDGGVLGAVGRPEGGGGTAVGLLLRAPDARGRPLVLLQRRAPGTLHGTRWGLPGGRRRGNETPTATALRAAAEQAGVHPGRVRVRGEQVHRDVDTCAAVIADAAEPLPVPPDHEVADLAWVPESEVAARDLDPAFAAGWSALQVIETGLLVDAANVVGSRPDGWWRDRVGAAERLLSEIAAVGLPGVLAIPEGGFRWFARPVVVLEGKANRAPDVAGVEVIRAPASGDDTIVDVARRDGDWMVVTADRGLRARLPVRARPVGPSTLRSWLTHPESETGAWG
ncbi:MAG: NUDIX domain-containing protein [Pseudonocardiaceae bacterium]